LSNPDRRDRIRRIVHFAFGACALLVEPLGPATCIGLAAAALLYNAVVAPATGLDRAYRREGEGRLGGLVTYPLAVLLLLVAAPAHVAAGAWAVLACADPAAAAVGGRWSRAHVPWCPRKSFTGTAAGFVAGALGCWAVLATIGRPHPVPAIAAAAAGALAETVPLRDDNLAVAGAAALALLAFPHHAG
jgi:dolichol kinase